MECGSSNAIVPRCLGPRSGWAASLHPGSRVLGKLRRAFQIQLSLYLFAVILDGLDAQVQLFRDLLGLFPPANELEYLHLAVAQALYRRLMDVFLASHLLLQHLRAQRVTDVNG